MWPVPVSVAEAGSRISGTNPAAVVQEPCPTRAVRSLERSLTSVLIVDDEPAVRNIMARWVLSLGLRPTTAANADEALASIRTHHYDLAVIDVMMPGHDGLWLATELQRDHPHTAVVIATAYTALLDTDAQQRPIADLLVKPFQRERFALAVDRGRQWRQQTIQEVQWHARLATELQDRTAQLIATLRDRAAAGASEENVLTALSVDRLPEMVAHGERVARYAHSLARELGVSDELGAAFETSARFHDIGKIAMPEALLTKPSPFTAGEMAIMRRHVDIGAEILQSTRTLGEVAATVMASHEWFSGGGYPLRLTGGDIPLSSRIIAVVDAYDTMTQDRVYRVRLNSADAVAELLRCSRSQFDPDVVAGFLATIGRH
ncbi:MAG: response regulator [Acidobacteria bacterium]|nr:response regulator [Acidobacteriota bacterium]